MNSLLILSKNTGADRCLVHLTIERTVRTRTVEVIHDGQPHRHEEPVHDGVEFVCNGCVSLALDGVLNAYIPLDSNVLALHLKNHVDRHDLSAEKAVYGLKRAATASLPAGVSIKNELSS
jgi:hypothetical protein